MGWDGDVILLTHPDLLWRTGLRRLLSPLVFTLPDHQGVQEPQNLVKIVLFPPVNEQKPFVLFGQ